ncbi:MAG: 30S ribosome-binding factor RbfA [Thiohalomonadaceae bacterium]
MARDYSRTDRIADQIQRELALLIQQEIRDPRLGMVTVSAVELSRDLAVAKVFVSVLGDAEQAKTALAVLKKAGGFLRHELGRRMIMRVLPELRFVHDTSTERGSHLSALIEQAVANDRKEESED